MSSFKSRAVTFTIDREGRIAKVTGYSGLHQKVEIRIPKGSLRLHARTYEDAAFSLGFRDPDDFTRHLCKQGMVVAAPKNEPPRFLQWLATIASN